MRLPARAVALVLLAVACRRAPVDASVGPPASPDAAVPDVPDAGTPVVFEDAGTPDAGTPDGGAPDAGPVRDAHRVGGLGQGPWPVQAITVYGAGQGLLEAPISASVDEAENLWVVTGKALYLLAPGATVFHRYTAQDGLHVGPGWTEPPDFTLVQGGGPNECFVGYYAHDTHDAPGTRPPVAHTANDPVAHLGKMDQVLLKQDGTLEVRRYDLHNSNDGFYYETRTIMSMVYDHFQHPGELYAGSNHGITRIVPARWRLPQSSAEQSNPISVEREWYADHVHPWVCMGGPCSDTWRPSTFGDWYGLTLADDGHLWMGGLTSAGAINWRPTLGEWVQSWQPHNPFDPAFGDPYPGNSPVFDPPQEGDWVNIRAVAATRDGTVWFASGEVENWRGRTYGLAAWNGHTFTTVDPTSLGALEYNILELQAWPDGRLVLGFPSTGLLVWTPGDRTGHRVGLRDGLPGEQIGRLSLDTMHAPPLLLVPTEGGLAVLRDLP